MEERDDDDADGTEVGVDALQRDRKTLTVCVSLRFASAAKNLPKIWGSNFATWKVKRGHTVRGLKFAPFSIDSAFKEVWTLDRSGPCISYFASCSRGSSWDCEDSM